MPKLSKNDYRFAGIIDNHILSRATEYTLKSLPDAMSIEKLKCLTHTANKNPATIIVFDSGNNLVAYSLENTESLPPKILKISKLFRTKISPMIFTPKSRYLTFHFPDSVDVEKSGLSVLIHDYRGLLKHFTIKLEEFIPSLTNKNKIFCDGLYLEHVFAGHNKSVQRLIRTADGTAALSASRYTENAVWALKHIHTGLTLQKKSVLKTPNPVLQAVVIRKGHLIVTLSSNELILWDGKQKEIALQLATFTIDEGEDPICFLHLPEATSDHDPQHIVAIYNEHKIRAWEFATATYTHKDYILEIKVSNLPIEEDLYKVVAMDPVGWNSTISSKLDVYQRDVLTTISKNGLLQCWTASFDPVKRQVTWLESCKFPTGLNNISKLSGASTKKVAIVSDNNTTISIYDTKRSFLEFTESFNKDQTIQDLDWYSSPSSQSILAIGFPTEVLLYTQLRYDYTNETPSWAAFKRVDVSHYTTHHIGDSIWMKEGTLVVAAGNQFFVQDKKVEQNDSLTQHLIGSREVNAKSIFDIVDVLNGPLPYFHPQFLTQLIFAGKFTAVEKILLALLQAFREVNLDPHKTLADIHSDLGLAHASLFASGFNDKPNNKKTNGFNKRRYSGLFEQDVIPDEVYHEFNEKSSQLIEQNIKNIVMPYLTRHQQISLASVVEAMSQVEKNKRSLDEAGIKFYLGFKLFQIHRGKQTGVTMRDINWAFHSNSKEILLDLVKTSTNYKLTWTIAKESGLPYWLDENVLKTEIENVARNSFTMDDKRDPINCSLFYMALKKKSILLGLWKTCSWNPEHAKMVKFLANDFEEPRWRSAALKNAFVLLSKHRPEYAASFFLLAGSLKDAVNVIIKQLNDIPLAVAVARVYGGDDSESFKSLLEDTILKKAVADGDRWTTSWIYWKLGKSELGVRALIVSPDEVEVYTAVRSSKYFLEADPVLIMLYKTLRDKVLYKLKEETITQELEFNAVLNVAGIYDRMGCDFLALDLIKNWEFIKPIKKIDDNNEISELEAQELQRKFRTLQRKSSVFGSNPLGNITGDSEKDQVKSLKPPPTMFEEPDMSAFSFGF